MLLANNAVYFFYCFLPASYKNIPVFCSGVSVHGFTQSDNSQTFYLLRKEYMPSEKWRL